MYVNRRTTSSMITNLCNTTKWYNQFNWLHSTIPSPQQWLWTIHSTKKTVTEQGGKQFNPHLTWWPSPAGLRLSWYYTWLPGRSLCGYPLSHEMFRSLSLGSQYSVHHPKHRSACGWWITIHLPEEEAVIDAVVFCTSKGLKHLAED